MKKQTLQFILGFFLIFSALPALADFAAPAVKGWGGSYSMCGTITVPCSDYCTSKYGTYFGELGCTIGPDIYPSTQLYYCRGNSNKKIYQCKSDNTPSCPANSTLTGSTCTCNAPYRQDYQIGLLSTSTVCTYPYTQPSTDILNYAIGLGLFGGGVAAGLASCTFGITPTCAASALAVLAGGGLIGAAAYPDGSAVPSPSPDPCANKTCVSVQLDPSKPVTGAETYVSRDSDGNFKPEGSGWTNNGDGTHTANVTDGQVTVNTNTDRVSSVLTNNAGTWSAAIQSGNLGGGLEFVAQGQNLETSYTQQFTGSFNEQGVQQSQSQASAGTKPSNWNYNGALTGGGTGTGTGTGDGTGTGGGGTGTGTGGTGGDCAEYGCAKETTLKQISDELKNTHYAESTQVKNDINDLADDGINEAADRMGNMLQGMIEHLGLDELFDSILDNLPIQQLIETNASNCSYAFSLLGKPYELSICQYQSTIHSVIAFLFFIALSFGIVSLIFERPQGS